ncbi:MAG: hypothetical protein RML93_04220, partial [Anaerolineales bacterium]|nr:hypothetical protein [Anaerolineales bacterium]MDW8446483.1 hypothetical protein [Anaerolineales bacterium]
VSQERSRFKRGEQSCFKRVAGRATSADGFGSNRDLPFYNWLLSPPTFYADRAIGFFEPQ